MSPRSRRPAAPFTISILAVLIASVALATPTLRLGPSPVSTVVYPAQELSLRFDHRSHIEDLSLGCSVCHPLAATSRSPSDNLLPRESVCVDCHPETTRVRGRGPSRAEARCQSCHETEGGRIAGSLIPTARLRFAHADHDDEQCARCHTRVALRGLATADDLPSMPLCLGCHDGRRAPRTCETCHPSQPDGRLRVDFDGQWLRPPSWMSGLEHGPEWERAHGVVATEQAALCERCHQQQECLACHDGNVRPREVHPGDWLTAHSIEARGRELDCTSCHRGQSFCRTCHLRAGVSWRSPLGLRDMTDSVVHRAPDWVSEVAPRHGREARRNLQTCVSCHVGQDCVSCHVSINPHGPGWARRCAGLRRAGSMACEACHGSLVPDCE